MEVNNFLEPILKRQENKTCADCPNKNPRWASISFGTFVCIQCAGIHRNLGVHITKIKSVTLDKWNDDMMMVYDKMNNIIANQFWEARIVESQRPGAGVRSYVQEKFIRDKYIDKKFAKQNEQDPATRILKGEDIGRNKQDSQQQSNVKQANQQQVQPQQVVNYAKPTNLQNQQQNTIAVKPKQEQIDLLQLDQSDKVEFTEFQQAEEVKDAQKKTNVLGNDQLVNIDWGSPQALNINQNFNQQQQQPTQQANVFQQQQFYQAPQQQQQQNVTNAILNLYNQVPQSQLQQNQDKNKFIPQGMIAAQNYIQQPQMPPMYGGGYMYQQQQYMPVQNNVYMNMGYQQNSTGNTGAYYGNQGWGQK